MHALLEESSKVFLCGIAGIGKSELAKAYARTYRKEYTNILYLMYSGDLRQDIIDLDFSDDLQEDTEEERFRKHNRFLRSLKADTLLIIDNFNTTATKDNFLSVVLKYRCRVIFTTRSLFDNYTFMELKEISDPENLLSLMGCFYSGTQKHASVLKQIIQTVHSHTLAVELSARLLESRGLSAADRQHRLCSHPSAVLRRIHLPEEHRHVFRQDPPTGEGCLRKPAAGSFSAEKHGNSHVPSYPSDTHRKEMIAIAIYHMSAKVVSRGAGRSAVAASAYLSCSRMYNDYDGIQHDYTRKRGLAYQEVLLPPMAPPEWKDREQLWNAVEQDEKTKDSRLAREFVPALPIELTPAQWQELLTDFIQNNFVADGMCADVAVHDPYPPGHNPHAHIMVTVRPLDEKGNWQYKTEKEYVCLRNGEERGFTAAEFKAAQADGWEKQYPYKVGRKKVYLPPSEAEKNGYERVSKYPKSTKYGRQNPISERWNSEEQLVEWRKAWADAANRYLERYGHEERIDHRSHAERGLDEQPIIHEGVAARALERQGIISDRCEINRQIKADNALQTMLCFVN